MERDSPSEVGSVENPGMAVTVLDMLTDVIPNRQQPECNPSVTAESVTI